MSRPSLLSPYDESFLTLTSTTFLPSFPDPKSAGQAHFRTSTEKLGYLAKSGLHTKNDEKGIPCVERRRLGRIQRSIFRTEVKATEWAVDRFKETFREVAKDEARKLSTVQEIMIRSTDYLRRIVAPAGGMEALRCHTCARIVTVSRWRTTFGGSQG